MSQKRENVALSAVMRALIATIVMVLIAPAKSAETESPTTLPVQTVNVEALHDTKSEQEDIHASALASLLYGFHEIGVFTITYYDTCVECCGKADGITVSGTAATPYETCAVDPAVIPLGSDVLVDFGNGEINCYRAEDTGVPGHWIDICVSDHQEALELGRSTATVYLMEAGS